MKNLILAGALVLTVLITLGFARQTPRVQYEHKWTIHFKEVVTLGLEGWELVAVEGFDGGARFFLRRAK